MENEKEHEREKKKESEREGRREIVRQQSRENEGMKDVEKEKVYSSVNNFNHYLSFFRNISFVFFSGEDPLRTSPNAISFSESAG